MSEEISRRKYLKYVGAGAAVAAAAGVGYWAWKSTRPSKVKPLRWMGGSWIWYDDIVNEFKEETGINVEEVGLLDIPTMVSKIKATGGRDVDVFYVSTTVATALIKADPPVMRETPVGKIPRWKDENVSPLWKEPELYIPEHFAEDLNSNAWIEGQEGKRFAVMPEVYNFDAFGYNPEFVDRTLTSWGDLVDREFAGKVAIIDLPTEVLNKFSVYLEQTDQITPEKVYDLKPAEIDILVDWLITHKKAGQFVKFWTAYGEDVNLHVTKEIWISDAWQPICFDVRRAGVPMYYAEPEEGYMYWFNGEFPAIYSENLAAAYKWMDFRLSGWFARFISRIGYTTPTYMSKEVKDEFGPEYYGWNFLGKRTYKPITEMFPGKSERIANALFVPEEYDWNMAQGTESSTGNRRDGGPIDERIRKISTLTIWLEYADYYYEAWDRFKAS